MNIKFSIALLLCVASAFALATSESHIQKRSSCGAYPCPGPGPGPGPKPGPGPGPGPGPNPGPGPGPCPANCTGAIVVPCPENPMGVIPEVNELVRQINGPLQQTLGNLLGTSPTVKAILALVDQLIKGLTGCPSNAGDFPPMPMPSLLSGVIDTVAGGK